MPFCFSHMPYLSLRTEVAREGKKQATVTAITYMEFAFWSRVEGNQSRVEGKWSRVEGN